VGDLDQVFTAPLLGLSVFFLRLLLFGLFLLRLFFFRLFGLLALRLVFFLIAAAVTVFLGLARTACESTDDCDTTGYLEKVPSS